MNATANEIKVLEAIRDSEYNDAGYVGHHVWTDYINPFPESRRTMSGVVASLVKKGLVTIYRGSTSVTGQDPSTIALTQAGYDLVKLVEPAAAEPAELGPHGLPVYRPE